MPSTFRHYCTEDKIWSEWPEELDEYRTRLVDDNFLERRGANEGGKRNLVDLCMDDCYSDWVEIREVRRVKQFLKDVKTRGVGIRSPDENGLTTWDIKRHAWVDAKYISKSGNIVGVDDGSGALEKPLTAVGLYRTLSGLVSPPSCCPLVGWHDVRG
jgi:hypothetical protein